MSFTADLTDLKKLEKFFRKAPEQLKKSTANVLTGMAFEARKADIDILAERLTIRNRRFVESSIRVEKARPERIESQVALVGSVNGPRFTGWKEQETGQAPAKFKSASTTARGGNKRGTIKPKARFRQGNRFYKVDQFQGRSLQQRFYFMMRVLNTRGGQQSFLLSQNIPTKRGVLPRGLYMLNRHKITRLRTTGWHKSVKRLQWNERMIHELQHKRVVERLWKKELDALAKKGRM